MLFDLEVWKGGDIGKEDKINWKINSKFCEKTSETWGKYNFIFKQVRKLTKGVASIKFFDS